MVHVALSSGIATRRGVYERCPVYHTAGLGPRFYFRWYGCLDVPMHQELCSTGSVHKLGL